MITLLPGLQRQQIFHLVMWETVQMHPLIQMQVQHRQNLGQTLPHRVLPRMCRQEVTSALKTAFLTVLQMQLPVQTAMSGMYQKVNPIQSMWERIRVRILVPTFLMRKQMKLLSAQRMPEQAMLWMWWTISAMMAQTAEARSQIQETAQEIAPEMLQRAKQLLLMKWLEAQSWRIA